MHIRINKQKKQQQPPPCNNNSTDTMRLTLPPTCIGNRQFLCRERGRRSLSSRHAIFAGSQKIQCKATKSLRKCICGARCYFRNRMARQSPCEKQSKQRSAEGMAKGKNGRWKTENGRASKTGQPIEPEQQVQHPRSDLWSSMSSTHNLGRWKNLNKWTVSFRKKRKDTEGKENK